MKTTAKKIAALIVKTPTEKRGDLFLLVAQHLNLETQYYTGRLFEKLGKFYGTS